MAFGAAAASAGSTLPALEWTHAAPASGPPALRNPAVAYDGDIHSVVLFGGTMPDGTLSNQTWLFNGSTWSSGGGGPAARTGASMAFDPARHQLILFGGADGTGTLLDDTWAWNGASWYLDTPAASPPPGRQGATLAADPAGNLVLFGGTGAPVATSQSQVPATTVPAAVASSAAPSGGVTTLNDTWTWDGTGWSQALPTTSPPARTDAAATYDPVHNLTVLFGGSTAPDGTSATAPALDDTWTWTGTAWAQVATASAPPPRSSAVLAGDPDAGGAVLFGGSAAGTALDDTWSWTGTAWTALHPGGTPPATSGAGATYDDATGSVVVYGGNAGVGPPAATTYLLGRAPIAHTPSPPTTAPPKHVATPVTVPAVIRPARPTPTTSTTRPAATPATGPVATPPTAPPVNPGAAGGPPPSLPAVERVHPGASVLLIGAGFRPGASILVTFHSLPQTIGTFTASAQGTFSATVTVPEGAQLGSHHFVMTGPSPTGAMTTISTAVLVVATATAHHGTGLQTPILVAIALLLPAGTWMALALVARRRTPTTPA